MDEMNLEPHSFRIFAAHHHAGLCLSNHAWRVAAESLVLTDYLKEWKHSPIQGSKKMQDQRSKMKDKNRYFFDT